MVWCSACKADVEVEVDDAHGFSCCLSCGKVLDDIHFSSDVQFTKGADGESEAVGNLVTDAGVARGLGRMAGGARLYGYQVDSQERSLNKARSEIANLVDRLAIRPRDETIETAFRLYRLAANKNFTRGRKSQQVQAACVYIVCRQDSKPFMLIDFSDQLQVNLYSLGAVFLRLCKELKMDNHPLINAPVDPSLFIHRFADKLNFANKQITQKVSTTALRLVANMKRDWIQTGRRPASVCGAALFVAAQIHGNPRSKAEVIHVVHVGAETLEKRVLELTAVDLFGRPFKDLDKEFDDKASEREKALEEAEIRAVLELTAGDEAKGGEGAGVGAEGAEITPATPASAPPKEECCDHIQLHNAPHFANKLCRDCFVSYVRLCGGLEGQLNPPAFDRTLKQDPKPGKAPLALPAPRDPVLDEEEENMRIEMDNLLAHADEGMLRITDGRELSMNGAAREGDSEGEETGAQRPRRPRLDPQLVAAVAAGEDGEGVGEAEERRGSERTAGPSAPPPAGKKGRGRGKKAAARSPTPPAQKGTPEKEAPSGGRGTPGGERAGEEGPPPGQEDAPALPPLLPEPEEGPREGAIVPVAAAPGDEGGVVAAVAAGQEGAAAVVAVDPLLKEEVSDLDEELAAQMLHTDEEAELKWKVWAELNRDFLEAQAAKKKAAEEAAAKEAAGGVFTERKRPGRKKKVQTGEPAAQEPHQPAESAEAAAHKMLEKKLSSKINYSALMDLFGDDAGKGKGKRREREEEGGQAEGEEGEGEEEEGADEEPAPPQKAVAPPMSGLFGAAGARSRLGGAGTGTGGLSLPGFGSIPGLTLGGKRPAMGGAFKPAATGALKAGGAGAGGLTAPAAKKVRFADDT